MHSCETALIKVMDGWMEAIDKGELIGTIFLDLQGMLSIWSIMIYYYKNLKYMAYQIKPTNGSNLTL